MAKQKSDFEDRNSQGLKERELDEGLTEMTLKGQNARRQKGVIEENKQRK